MTEILWFKSKQEQEIFVGCPKCQTDFRHSQSPIPLVPMALSQMLGQEVAHSRHIPPFSHPLKFLSHLPRVHVLYYTQ